MLLRQLLAVPVGRSRTMDAQTRLGWVELYQEIGNAGVVCRRCGISRPTLRKWWRRYQALGMAGLEEQSCRPHILICDCRATDQETALVAGLAYWHGRDQRPDGGHHAHRSWCR